MTCTDLHPSVLSADIDNSGFVSDFELQELFREASFSLPGYKVREIAEKFIAGDTNKDEKISFEEFVAVRPSAITLPILSLSELNLIKPFNYRHKMKILAAVYTVSKLTDRHSSKQQRKTSGSVTFN